MTIYLDGQWVDSNEARLSAFDAAVQHGVGLFETMRAYGGRVFGLEAHVRRLIQSAQQLGLSDRLRPQPLIEAVQQTLARSGRDAARLRLTVTGGDLALLANARSGSGAPEHRCSILIQATEPTVYPESFLADGVTVTIADVRANPFDPHAGHKTLNYWLRLRTLTQAAARQAAEALWFSVSNHLCGGAVSNAILASRGKLLTPFARGEEVEGALASPVLPGVTRAAVLEIAAAQGLSVDKRMLSIEDVLKADELMLTNSSWGILPVVRVEKQTIGDGRPGTVTRALYDGLLRKIAEDCAAA